MGGGTVGARRAAHAGSMTAGAREGKVDMPQGAYHSINLQIVPAEDARIHVSDIGLRRGFGAFDFLRLVDGHPLFLEDHLDRFERTAAMLGLELPVPRARLRTHVFDLIARNGRTEAGVQMFLTGGYAEDGFTPSEPNLVVMIVPLSMQPPERYDEGASLMLYRHQRDLPEAKTTNYATAVRLLPAMRAAGAADVLYHDGARLLETTRSNLFVVDAAGHLATPATGILRGVTRLNILRAIEGHIPVQLRDVGLGEVPALREAFVTSTTKGALPVRQIGDVIIGAGAARDAARRGDGTPGPVTRRVRELFGGYVTRHLASAPRPLETRAGEG